MRWLRIQKPQMFKRVCESEGVLMYPVAITTLKIKPVFMSSTHNTDSVEIKPQPTTAGSQDSNRQIQDKTVIPDECGDSLWDEVLAQHPDLTTIINKPTDTEPSLLQSRQNKL
jgi:hypothetical protein